MKDILLKHEDGLDGVVGTRLSHPMPARESGHPFARSRATGRAAGLDGFADVEPARPTRGQLAGRDRFAEVEPARLARPAGAAACRPDRSGTGCGRRSRT